MDNADMVEENSGLTRKELTALKLEARETGDRETFELCVTALADLDMQEFDAQ